MAFKRYLTLQERSLIVSLKNKGTSIFAISRELHRSRAIITKFLKNPEEYIRNMKANTTPSYELLNNNNSTVNCSDIEMLKNSSPTINHDNKTSVKKIIRKNYESPKKKTFTEDDIKRFNRVTVEHRAVIKYLIKKGIGPRFIYEDIQKVYGSTAPDLPSTLYWAKQYQQGRTTIFNDSKTSLPVATTTNTTSTSSNNKSTAAGAASKRIPEVKLFRFKFKPTKNL